MICRRRNQTTGLEHFEQLKGFFCYRHKSSIRKNFLKIYFYNLSKYIKFVTWKIVFGTGVLFLIKFVDIKKPISK